MALETKRVAQCSSKGDSDSGAQAIYDAAHAIEMRISERGKRIRLKFRMLIAYIFRIVFQQNRGSRVRENMRVWSQVKMIYKH